MVFTSMNGTDHRSLFLYKGFVVICLITSAYMC